MARIATLNLNRTYLFQSLFFMVYGIAQTDSQYPLEFFHQGGSGLSWFNLYWGWQIMA